MVLIEEIKLLIGLFLLEFFPLQNVSTQMHLNKKTLLFLKVFLISFSFLGNVSAVASTEIQRKKAISLLKTTQYSIGLQKLQNLAKKGDAPSYYVLGVLHLSGKFFKANANRALMNFESSAELCYPKAMTIWVD